MRVEIWTSVLPYQSCAAPPAPCLRALRPPAPPLVPGPIPNIRGGAWTAQGSAVAKFKRAFSPTVEQPSRLSDVPSLRSWPGGQQSRQWARAAGTPHTNHGRLPSPRPLAGLLLRPPGHSLRSPSDIWWARLLRHVHPPIRLPPTAPITSPPYFFHLFQGQCDETN